LFLINQSRPEILAKIFNPDEIADITKRIESERKIMEEAGNILVDAELLSKIDTEAPYIRYVLSKEFQKRLK